MLLNVLLTKMTIDWFIGREIGTALAILVSSWPVGIGVALVTLPWLAVRTSAAAGFASTATVAALVLVLVVAIYRAPPAAMIPDAVKIGYVVNVASGVIIDRQELESMCQRLGIKAVPAEVRSPDDLDAAFQAFANDHVQAVIVLVEACFLVSAAGSQPRDDPRLPAIYGFRDHVDAGGLASYGVNLSENFHRAATYVNKFSKEPNQAICP